MRLERIDLIRDEQEVVREDEETCDRAVRSRLPLRQDSCGCEDGSEAFTDTTHRRVLRSISVMLEPAHGKLSNWDVGLTLGPQYVNLNPSALLASDLILPLKLEIVPKHHMRRHICMARTPCIIQLSVRATGRRWPG